MSFDFDLGNGEILSVVPNPRQVYDPDAVSWLIRMVVARDDNTSERFWGLYASECVLNDVAEETRGQLLGRSRPSPNLNYLLYCNDATPGPESTWSMLVATFSPNQNPTTAFDLIDGAAVDAVVECEFLAAVRAAAPLDMLVPALVVPDADTTNRGRRMGRDGVPAAIGRPVEDVRGLQAAVGGLAIGGLQGGVLAGAQGEPNLMGVLDGALRRHHNENMLAWNVVRARDEQGHQERQNAYQERNTALNQLVEHNRASRRGLNRLVGQNRHNDTFTFEQPPGIPGINEGRRVLRLGQCVVQAHRTGETDNFFQPDVYHLKVADFSAHNGGNTWIGVQVCDAGGIPIPEIRRYQFAAKHLMYYADWLRLDRAVQNDIIGANIMYRYRG